VSLPKIPFETLDIAFFYYGLAYILLAAVCLPLQRKDGRRLPWGYLGGFGLFLGLVAWLNLFAISFGDNILMLQLRIVLMSLGFLSLLEFGRRGIIASGNRAPGLWIHIPLVLLAATGVFFDPNGLKITPRYALAVPGGIMAVIALLRTASQSRTGRLSLWAISAAMIGITLTSGLFAARGEFFPANFLHQDFFQSVFGISIQFARCVLALAAALALTLYYSAVHQSGSHNQIRYIAGPFSKWLLPGLTFILALGWIATTATGIKFKNQIWSALSMRAQIAVSSLEPHHTLLVFDSNDSLRTFARTRIGAKLSRQYAANKDLLALYVCVRTEQNTLTPLISDSIGSRRGNGQSGRQSADWTRSDISTWSDIGNSVRARLGDHSQQAVLAAAVPETDLHPLYLVMVIRVPALTRGFFRDRLFPLGTMLFITLALIAMDLAWRRSRESAVRIAESEERYRSVVEYSPESIFILQSDSILFANRAAAHMLGAGGPEELIGQSFRNLAAHGLREITAQTVNQAADKPSSDTPLEVRLLRRDGASVDVELIAVKLVFDQHTATMILCRDVTEQRRAQKAIRESEERYIRLFNESLAGNYVSSPDGRILLCNSAFARMLGFASIADATSESSFSFYPTPAARSRFLDMLQENKRLEQYETELIRADGSRLFAIENVVGVFDENDRLVRLHGNIVDITARKEAEEAVRTSEERYRTLIENQGEGIGIIDEAGRFFFANPAAHEIFGVSDGQLHGRSLWEFWRDYSTENVLPQWQQQEAGTRSLWEAEIVRPDGQNRHLLVTATPRFDGVGQYIGTFAVFRDISERKLAESALHESQRAMSTLLSNLQGMAYRCRNDADWTMEFVSNGSLGLTGYAPQDLVNNQVVSYSDLIRPEDRDIVWNAVQTALTQDSPFRLIYRIHTADGTQKWVWEQGQGVYDDKGSLRAIEGYISDITERKLAEEALEKRLIALTRPLGDTSNLQFEDLFNVEDVQRIQDAFAEAAGVASIITDTTGKPITKPSNFCYLCENIIRKTERGRANCYRSDAILGRMSKDGPQIQPCLSGGLWDGGTSIRVGDRHIANWLIGQVLDEDADPEKMMRYAEAIGADEEEFRTALSQVKRMPREQFSRICQALYLIANQMSSLAVQNIQQAREITERRRAEEALRQSERRFRDIVEKSDDAIYVWQNNRIVLINPKFRELSGYSLDEMTAPGFSILNTVAESDRDRVSRHLRILGTYDTAVERYSFKGLAKNGKLYEMEASVTEITWDGAPAWLGVLRDMTAQHALETQVQQSQRLESIGRLAGGVAHDFNNLLTIIGGHADLALLKLSDEDPLRPDVEEILKTANRAGNLTRQLLAFSRKQVIEPEIIDLNSTISDMKRMLTRIIGEDISLITETADDLWNVKADPGQIEQVVVNLAVNARDAMPDGGTLRLATANVVLDREYAATHLEVEPGNYVLLEVSDTGCGMDENVISRVFEPFFTTKPLGVGTGLGLATVYGIIRQSGGHITLESEVGRGSIFRIYLPKTDDTAAIRAPIDAKATRLTGTETILVVEDNEALRNSIFHTLKHFGYEVVMAADGDQAITMCKGLSGHVDLVLTDVIMPNLGGVELITLLKDVWPRIRVLLMSGYTDAAIIPDPQTPYIQKPFRPQALAQRIREILDAPR